MYSYKNSLHNKKLDFRNIEFKNIFSIFFLVQFKASKYLKFSFEITKFILNEKCFFILDEL